MKVEVEINCFVIEPTNQRYHANLFFYSWIRTDLDPSRRKFIEQTHGTVDVQQKSVMEYILPEHLFLLSSAQSKNVISRTRYSLFFFLFLWIL